MARPTPHMHTHTYTHTHALSPCAIFSLLNCMLQRAGTGPAGPPPPGSPTPVPAPLYDEILTQYLYTQLMGRAFRAANLSSIKQPMPSRFNIRISDVRDLFLSVCETELEFRLQCAQTLEMAGFVSAAALAAQEMDSRALLARIKCTASRLIQRSDAGSQDAALSLAVPLGASALPPYCAETEMFELLRVPVLHGWLPDPTSAEAVLLSRAPSLTNELVSVIGAAPPPGFSAEEFAVLQDYASDARRPSGVYGCTPAGLRGLAAAIQPGEVAVLFGGGHFSTVFRYPHPHPGRRDGYHALYRLAYEQPVCDQTLGGKRVSWGRLEVGEDGVPIETFCDKDFGKLVMSDRALIEMFIAALSRSEAMRGARSRALMQAQEGVEEPETPPTPDNKAAGGGEGGA